MPKRTILLLLFLAFVTGGLIFLAVTSENENQQPADQKTPATTKEIPSPVKKTATLSFDPSTLTVSPFSSASSSVDIVINTQNQPVSGVQPVILFDPKVITSISFNPVTNTLFGQSASNYTYLPLDVDMTNGKMSFMLAATPGSTPSATTGTIGTLIFTTRVAESTQQSTVITLLDESKVTQLNVGDSILKNTIPLTIQFSQ